MALNDCESFNSEFNLDDDITETIMTITELKETDVESIQMFLHPDILNHYDDFQDSLFNLLKDSSFYIKGNRNTSYHIVINYDEKYYSFVVEMDINPLLAVTVTKFNNLNEYFMN